MLCSDVVLFEQRRIISEMSESIYFFPGGTPEG
jgi:hypothetical protein